MWKWNAYESTSDPKINNSLAYKVNTLKILFKTRCQTGLIGLRHVLCCSVEEFWIWRCVHSSIAYCYIFGTIGNIETNETFEDKLVVTCLVKLGKG